MKKYFLYFLLSLFTTAAFCQNITGIVTDANTHEPLMSVTISADGNTTQTNGKGQFSIATNVKAITATMVGYNTATISLTANKVSIQLTPSTVDLQPVIVSASREGEARQDAPIAISKINSTVIKTPKPPRYTSF
ncbi:MAG: carboxypeptidase-like regulatory domain-containing protein [Mucilaginibacter sp.]|nr:carboxypeptidase-like regulatory domain-containing protein [Mucilaginibacter sp.]